MTAVAALCRRLGGSGCRGATTSPMASRAASSSTGCTWGEVRFDQHVDAMQVPRAWLTRALPEASQTAGRVARQECARQLEALGHRASLLDRPTAGCWSGCARRRCWRMRPRPSP